MTSITPTAPRLPIVGSLPFLSSTSSDFMLSTWRRLGDAYWMSLGRDRVLVIGHPEAAAEILENIDGGFPDKGGASGFRRSSLAFVGSGLSTWNGMDSDWRMRRSAVARAFRRARPVLRWSTPFGAIESLQLRQMLETRVVTDLATKLLGVDADPTDVHNVVSGFRLLAGGFWAGKAPWPRPILTRRVHNATDRLEEIVGKWVADSHADSPLRHHLPELGLEKIRDEVLSQLLSVATLAVPTEWALRLLAMHPETQRQLQVSVDRGEHELMYGVIREALRLCPSTYWVQRRAAHRAEIAGARVEVDDRVVIHIPSVHRHPEFWDHPDDFRPQRFVESTEWKGAWMPFGRASRLCVAQRYSTDAMESVLSEVVQAANISMSGTPRPFGARLNLVPRAGALTFTPR